MKALKSIWGRTKIVTLSRTLLIMMAGAGVFFTTAFLMIKSNTESILKTWIQLQANPELLSSGHAMPVQYEQLIVSTVSMIDWFIIAVLIAVAMFTLLMYFTLIGKIARPLEKMRQGIESITESNDFSTELPIKNCDEVGQVLTSFNHLTANLKQTFNETNSSLERVANGDFHQRVDLDVGGDLELFKNNVNASIDSVAATMDSLESIMDGISHGDFSVRMSDAVQGELKLKVDRAMQSMDNIIEDINMVMGNVTHCRFEQRVSAKADGRLDELKRYINEAMSGLESGLGAINTAIEELSNKDLTHVIEGDFQGEMQTLKHRLNNTSSQLNGTILAVSNGAADLNKEVAEIAEGNRALAERTQNQATSIDQTASAMEEMTATIQETAQNASDANEKTIETQKMAQQGSKVMEQTVNSMQAIQEESLKISDIISLIDTIAFQTNLLALNAAVEAARAGEQGRGFAVVATEVRNLAQKSADSAKQIGELITQVVEKVNLGAEQINETNIVFSQIHNGICTIDELVTSISHSAQEQSAGMLQMNQAISALDTGIRENAMLVEATKEKSDSLVSLSLNLQTEVDSFSINKQLVVAS